jgi:hypothetical protein
MARFKVIHRRHGRKDFRFVRAISLSFPLILYVGYRLCIIRIIHQQHLGYKVEEKLHLGVREQKNLNAAGLHY